MRQDDGRNDGLPFHAAAEPFQTRSFEEAAARLLFLSERRWPAGWLLGPAGCGKSALLRQVRRELRRSGSEAVLLSLCGMDADEFWSSMAAALVDRDQPGGMAARKSVRALLVASAMIDRPVTFLLDDADRAQPCLWEQIAGLVRMAEGTNPAHTVVIATAGEAPRGDLGRRIDLRAELRPFTAAETADFVTRRLKECGCTAGFAEDAMDELYAATAGVPAAIGRLADLALLAARSAESDKVTAELVKSAVAELRPYDDQMLVPMRATRLSA